MLSLSLSLSFFNLSEFKYNCFYEHENAIYWYTGKLPVSTPLEKVIQPPTVAINFPQSLREQWNLLSPSVMNDGVVTDLV